MPTVKRDRKVMRRHLIETAIFGGPFAVIIPYLIFHHDTQSVKLTQLIWAFPVLFLLGLIGAVRQWRRFHRFKCPTCGAMLSRRDARDDTPVAFVCQQCDTIWDTGFTDTSKDIGSGGGDGGGGGT